MTKHKIKILSEGNFVLPGVGFINGPVLSPYYETDANIFKMLGSGVKIVEVMPDGSEQKLTIGNYRTKATKPVVKTEDVKPNPNVVSVTIDPEKHEEEKPVEPEVKEEVTSEVHVVEDNKEIKEDVVIEDTAELTEDRPSENNKDNQYNKYNKNNKKHK